MNEFSQKVMAGIFLCGKEKDTTMNPFMAAEAGTPIAPSTSARYYYRRQIFSRNPITGSNFKAGATVNFSGSASGGHYLVTQESRIVCRLKVTDNAGTGKLAKSVRFACDPVANMFSAASLSVNGTTVESHAANVADVSRLQLRMEQTKAGAEAAGSAGLLSFNQKLTQEDRTGAGLNETSGGLDTIDDAGAPAYTVATVSGAYHNTDERSDKHQLLLDTSSGDGIATLDDVKLFEISVPISQIFTFCAQTKSFIPNIDFLMQLTINSDYRKDMFFSEQLRGQAGSAGVAVKAAATLTTLGKDGGEADLTAKMQLTAYVPPVAAVTDEPTVLIDELYLDAMYAVPSEAIRPPKSIQIPFQAMTLFTRTITGEGNFTEQFSGIPPSVGAIVVALRSNAHGLNKNRELYEKGTLITKASLSLGALQLPTPEYDISFPDRRFGRVFADWISFTGGSVSNGLGSDSLTEFAKSPVLAWRILQDPGSYSSTASLRFSVASAVGADCEIVMACIHQRVFEAYWQDGESAPSRVIVDDVLN